MGKRERGIQDRTVQRLLNEFKPHIVVRVKHGDAYAVVGDPDIYGCLTLLQSHAIAGLGRMFVFEVKNEDGTLTNIQVHRLHEFSKAGAIVGAIQDPFEAVQIIKKAMFP